MNKPTLLSRKDLFELFCSFAVIENNWFSRWQTDGQLKRNFKQHAQGQGPENQDEAGWVLYWHKQLPAENQQQTVKHSKEILQQSLPFRHLQAYSQDECFWKANRAREYGQSSTYTLEDFFQYGQLKFADIVIKFDGERGSKFKTFLGFTFDSVMRDYLRQLLKLQRCSKWSLLARTSKLRMRKALESYGEGKSDVLKSCLAHRCFKEIIKQRPKIKGREEMQEPDRKEWDAIHAEYQSHRLSAVPTHPSLSLEELKAVLDLCQTAVRRFLLQREVSLDGPRSDESDSSSLIERLETKGQSPIQDAIAQEWTSLATLLQKHLKQSFSALDPSLRQILDLYYRETLTQQAIAQMLDKKQVFVFRRLQKARLQLVSEAVRLTQTELEEFRHAQDRVAILDVPLTKDKQVLKTLDSLAQEWLEELYQSTVHPD